MTTNEASGAPWLLLIHQLPAKPAYARVKVWRRLQALGAVTVKGAVYALPANAEMRFDMFEGEFTHRGDRCTFEVLLAEAGLDDPALGAIGEIIHDIDLKDGKYGREEAAGIRTLIAGIASSHNDDNQRLERGGAVFDDLHRSFAGKRDDK